MKLGSSTPHTMTCGECPAGTLHRENTTLLTWLGNELITVPDFPAWVCDICGRREYDQRALSQLSLILSPTAGKPTPKRRKIPARPTVKTPRTRTAPE
jgi:YgiT-type zinc finger domain-containing protein